MRVPFLPFIILIALCVAIDVYIWRALRRRCRAQWPARLQLWSAVALYLFVAVVMALPHRTGSEELLLCKMWALFTFMSVYGSKLIFVVIDLLACLPRLWKGRRVRPVTHVGWVLAVVCFCSLWWGALVNRYRMQVTEVTVADPTLPVAFQGFRIVQISDLHTGTYGSDSAYLRRVVERVNSLHPDMIVFTGDIVNRSTPELEPHTGALKGLKAPYGVYSIMGNHDYGDYMDWADPHDKVASLQRLHTLQRDSMQWELLLNEHRFVHRGTDSIAIVGVENVGDPPFKMYGSLLKAYPTPSDSIYKVLLTHNPAHWTDSIAGRDDLNIPLTLSGHTHAMQVEVGGVSPAALRYRTWGGLYNDSDSTSMAGKRPHQLYVNIGIGTVGLPMRLGATPEITVITLTR